MRRNIQPRQIKYFCWNKKYAVMAYSVNHAFTQIVKSDIKGKPYTLISLTPQNNTGAFCFKIEVHDKRYCSRYYIIEPCSAELERRKDEKYKKKYMLNRRT